MPTGTMALVSQTNTGKSPLNLLNPRLQPHILLAWSVFLGISAAAWILGYHFPVAYIAITFEDRYAEWAECYLFAVAMVFSIRLAFSRPPYRWFFALLALACLFVVGEEISWGQRIFHFQAPEFFLRHNLQNETNLHNFITGPFHSQRQQVIEYILCTTMILYGLVYPLTLRTRWSVATWVNRTLGIPAPPLYIWPFFVAAGYLELNPLGLNDNEVAETLLAVALAVMTTQYWYAQRYNLQPPHPDILERRDSIRFTGMIGMLLAASTVLSIISSADVWSTAEDRERREELTLRSMEDFSKIYEGLGLRKTAIDVLLVIARKQPDRPYILLRIADNYRKIGDEVQFNRYNQAAMDVALARYREDRTSIKINIALARVYAQQGKSAQAGAFARQAYLIARERAEKEPNNPVWVYWLGETYHEGGYYRRALEQYRKAYEMEPNKYRRAYLDLKRLMEQGNLTDSEDVKQAEPPTP